MAKTHRNREGLLTSSNQKSGSSEYRGAALSANHSRRTLKSAWLTIGDRRQDKKPALAVCARDGRERLYGNQGLNPDKKQCYFIVYGNKLTLQRSYFGSIAVAKRVDENIEDIFAAVVYDGDVFKYKKVRGRDIVTVHEQELKNIKKDKIVAAYATVYYKDGTEASTIMTMDEIKQSRQSGVTLRQQRNREAGQHA